MPMQNENDKEDMSSQAQDLNEESGSTDDVTQKLQTIIDSLTQDEQSQLCDMLQAQQSGDKGDPERDIMREADDAGGGESKGYF